MEKNYTFCFTSVHMLEITIPKVLNLIRVGFEYWGILNTGILRKCNMHLKSVFFFNELLN